MEPLVKIFDKIKPIARFWHEPIFDMDFSKIGSIDLFSNDRIIDATSKQLIASKDA